MRLGEKEKTEKPVRQQSLKKEKKKGFLLLGWPKGLIPPPTLPHLTVIFAWFFRSVRTSCTSSGGPVRAQNLGHLYAGIYALWIIRKDIKRTPWRHGIPSTYLLTPSNPWGPLRPHWTPKHAQWPHRILKITCSVLQMIRGPIKCGRWSYGTP